MPNTNRQLAWKITKWLLFLVVIGAVVHQGIDLWNKVEFEHIQFSPLWLAAAVPVSVLAWCPAVGYWRALMVNAGETVRWGDVIRSYYCGHLGKYVPGKATVLIIRASLLQPSGVRPANAVLTSTYETLITMAAGIYTTIMLAPFVVNPARLQKHGFSLPDSHAFRWGLIAAVLVVSFAGLYVATHVFTWLVRRLVPRDLGLATGPPLPTMPFAQSARWFATILGGWWLHGLALGLTVHAVAGHAFSWSQWPLWTAAMAASSVAGFVVFFAPAGLFVREGLLFEFLEPHIGGPEAVVAAVLLRAAGLTGEILTATTLYYAVKPHTPESPPDAVVHHPGPE